MSLNPGDPTSLEGLDEALRDLMHRALEGDLGAPEQAALDRALQQDERARQAFEGLRHAHDLMRVLPRLAPPPGVARAALRDIAVSRALATPPPPVPSIAARVAQRVADDAHADVVSALRALPRVVPPASTATVIASRIQHEAHHNPAPLLLVGGLVAAFVLLVVTFAWPNLTVGVTVLRSLLAQVSPLAFVGFAMALGASIAITARPLPRVQRGGALAFALSAALTLPSLGTLFAGGDQVVARIGGDVVVDRPVQGDVIALGGNVILRPGARVSGQAVAFLGDVRQERGASVSGPVSALLGEVEGARRSLTTRPLPALGTASAFQPLLEWLGGSAWTRIYVAALGAIALLLFLTGVHEQIGRRQRHHPLRTLALGVLVFGLAVPPLVLGALSGFLVPAFVGGLLLLLALSIGLTVTLYDAACVLTRVLRLPKLEVVGTLVGLGAFAAALSVPPLAFALWVLGGCWGAGALLLTRPRLRA